MQKKGVVIFAAAMLLGVFLIVPLVRQSARSTTIGIGVAVVPVNSTFEIIAIVPGTSAANAGLHPGMVIQRINGASIMGAPLSRCIAMMRGPIGSRVQLVVLDPATRETNIVQCRRTKILLPADNVATDFHGRPENDCESHR